MTMNIGRSTLVICAVALTALAAYLVNFWPAEFAKDWISKDPSNWGQFGDYMGGILNPIVAFGAFLWLVESVRIQKKELAETREALRDSQTSQQLQADTALVTAHIQALNIELSGVVSRLSHYRAQQLVLLEYQNRADSPRTFKNPHGEVQSLEAARNVLAVRIIGLEDDEFRLLTEIKKYSTLLRPKFIRDEAEDEPEEPREPEDY